MGSGYFVKMFLLILCASSQCVTQEGIVGDRGGGGMGDKRGAQGIFYTMNMYFLIVCSGDIRG